MKKTALHFFLLLIFVFFSSQFAIAQSVAKITIKKNVDGITTEETRVVEINGDRDISDILFQMGVLDELGQLKAGQQFEINLQKNATDSSAVGMDWNVDRFDPFTAPLIEKSAFLGVILRSSDFEDAKGNTIAGAEITEVVDGTAASKAGLMVGDIISEIDGQKIESYNNVITIIQSKNPGDKIKLTINRDEKKKSMKIELGERKKPKSSFSETYPEQAMPFDLGEFDYFFNPDSITIICPDSKNSPCDSMKICQPFSWNSDGFETHECPFLGVTPGEPTDRGVRIGEIVTGSCAEQMGLMKNDIITEINSIAIVNFDSLRNVIRSMKAHEPIEVKVNRDGKEKTFSGLIGTKSSSQRDDFRIFHDFKGLDENGNYTYDFEFDMDEQDIEKRMEDLMLILEEQQLILEERQHQIQEQLDQLRQGSTNDQIRISIQIEDITEEDIVSINKSAKPKIDTDNTLSLDKISFFPNPTDGQITLTLQPKNQGDVTIVIYDINGAQVYYELVAGVFGVYSNVIDLSEQSSGNYFLRIMQNGQSFTKKIVLEK